MSSPLDPHSGSVATIFARALLFVVVVLLPLTLCACGAERPAGPENPPTHTYTVRGIVDSLPTAGSDFRVHHEPIPDWFAGAFDESGQPALGMAEMTMTFPVPPEDDLVGVQIGDKVELVLHTWVTDRLVDAKTASLRKLDPDTELNLTLDQGEP